MYLILILSMVYAKIIRVCCATLTSARSHVMDEDTWYTVERSTSFYNKQEFLLHLTDSKEDFTSEGGERIIYLEIWFHSSTVCVYPVN